MTNRKYHWAIQVVPSMHPHAWRAHAGGYYAQACGRRKKSAVGYPAERFVAKSQRNPDWYCSDCARAACLALAKERAPKPDTHTDSERYAELRTLVEAWQTARSASERDRASIPPAVSANPTGQPEGWLSRFMDTCEAETSLAEWNHR